MKRILCTLVLGLLVVPLAARDLEPGTAIQGDYLEARTAEVFVGFCLANGEVDIFGKEAILAWNVTAGAWDGVALDGLSVLAVVQSEETLGDPDMDPSLGRSVLLVDQMADAEQGEALVRMARALTGPLLDEIVSVEAVPIEVVRRDGHGLQAVRAGDVAHIAVRDRHHADGLCGNEDVFYSPLAELDEAHVTYTLRNEFSGQGLDGTWKSPGKTSSWVGSFSR